MRRNRFVISRLLILPSRLRRRCRVARRATCRVDRPPHRRDTSRIHMRLILCSISCHPARRMWLVSDRTRLLLPLPRNPLLRGGMLRRLPDPPPPTSGLPETPMLKIRCLTCCRRTRRPNPVSQRAPTLLQPRGLLHVNMATCSSVMMSLVSPTRQPGRLLPRPVQADLTLTESGAMRA